MLNLVVMTGRITADPEIKTTPNGVPTTAFSIANQRNFKNANDERETDFYNVVAWRNNAEHICKYFKKGSLITIEGHLQTRRYTDKNGNNRTAFELIVDKPHFADSRKASGDNNTTEESQCEISDDDFPEIDYPTL